MYTYFTKSNNTLTTILLAAVATSTSAYKELPDEGKGQYYANAVKHEIHAEYLNCYPLSSKEDKKQCTQELNKKYLKKHLSDTAYVTSLPVRG